MTLVPRLRRWQQVDAYCTPLRARPLWCVVLGLLTGSLLGTAADLPLWPLSGALGLALACTALLWPLPQMRGCCRLALMGLALTALPLAWRVQALPEQHIARLVDTLPRQVTIEGSVDRAVEVRQGHAYVTLALQRLDAGPGWQPVTGLVRLHVPVATLPLLPGDVVQVARLRVQAVRSSHNPDGFDFERFMRWRGLFVVGGVSKPERLMLQQRPAGWRLDRALEQWRQQLRAVVQAEIPAPYAAVFLAMVLGQRGDLTPEVVQSFRASGTTHLLVVSGLNVSCVALAVFLAWRTVLRLVRSWLPRSWCPGWRPTPWAALLSVPPVLLYCSLVGWEIPATRAALMVGSFLLTLMLQRQRAPMHALILAAGLILLSDPTAGRDLAFQLSFVAVASMILVGGSHGEAGDEPQPVLRRWGGRARAYLLVNSAAYLGTVPIVSSAFHTVQTFAILANLPLVPLAGLLTQAGVAALALVSGWPSLAPWVLAPFTPLLRWSVAFVDAIATWPAAQWYMAAPSWPMILGYYGLLGSLGMRRYGRRCWGWVGVCGAVILAGAGWQYLDSRVAHLRVTFLDVGSGDAIIVQVPGHTLMIDGGGTYDGRFDPGRQIIAPWLWQQYIRRFDLMVLTHMHPDHARGLASLLRLFPARQLLTNASPMTSDYLRDLLDAAQRWGTRHDQAPASPRQWQWGGLAMTLLVPPDPTTPAATPWRPRNENDRSLVLRLQYGAVRLLLTGDMEADTERWLLAQGVDVRADILKVGHHGSKTSTTSAFVQQVQPRVGIISTGAGNPFGHPHAQTLTTLAQHGVEVWRTDQQGAITLTSDGHGYQLSAVRPVPPSRPAQDQALAPQALRKDR